MFYSLTSPHPHPSPHTHTHTHTHNTIGAEVEALYAYDGKWYKATIVSVHRHKKGYKVFYPSDGSTQQFVPAANIRQIES